MRKTCYNKESMLNISLKYKPFIFWEQKLKQRIPFSMLYPPLATPRVCDEGAKFIHITKNYLWFWNCTHIKKNQTKEEEGVLNTSREKFYPVGKQVFSINDMGWFYLILFINKKIQLQRSLMYKSLFGNCIYYYKIDAFSKASRRL